MSSIDRYVKRLQKNGGNSRESQINQTIKSYERKFASSPSYYEVLVDGVKTDAIINKIGNRNTRKYETKLINFRHDYKPKCGSVITFDNENYLLMETDHDPIYSFGRMTRCNQAITLSFNQEEVFIGYDDRGRPLYETSSEQKEFPCIVSSERYSSSENTQLPLPSGHIVVYMTYIENEDLAVNKEFMFFGRKYKIVDIDLTQVEEESGLIEILMDRKVV